MRVGVPVLDSIRRIGIIPAHRPPCDRQDNAFSAVPEGDNRVAVSRSKQDANPGQQHVLPALLSHQP